MFTTDGFILFGFVLDIYMERPLADKRIIGPVFSSTSQKTRQFDKVIVEVNDDMPKYTVKGKYNTRGTMTTGLSIDTHTIVLNGLTSFSVEDYAELLADSDDKITIEERTKDLVNIKL